MTKELQHLKTRLTSMLINLTKSENTEVKQKAEKLLKKVKYMREATLYKLIVEIYEYSKTHEEFLALLTLLQVYIASRSIFEGGKNE